jgi:hypothetical protein
VKAETDVHKEDPSDEAKSLAISYVLVQQGVGLQEVK